MSVLVTPTSPHAVEVPEGSLTEAEQTVLVAKKKALDGLLQGPAKGKYKIELIFGQGRSAQRAIAGGLTFWESGSKLRGGGDTAMHLCPGKFLGRNECEAFIPDSGHAFGFLLCPKCFSKWDGAQVHNQVLGRWTLQQWAAQLHKYYARLEHNSDVVLKYYPGSLRTASEQEQAKQRLGESFGKVRGQRKIVVYTQANILRDVSAGADLEKRFLHFLKA